MCRSTSRDCSSCSCSSAAGTGQRAGYHHRTALWSHTCRWGRHTPVITSIYINMLPVIFTSSDNTAKCLYTKHFSHKTSLTQNISEKKKTSLAQCDILVTWRWACCHTNHLWHKVSLAQCDILVMWCWTCCRTKPLTQNISDTKHLSHNVTFLWRETCVTQQRKCPWQVSAPCKPSVGVSPPVLHHHLSVR